MKRCSSEIFEPKKKKIWSNLFSNKENKLRGLSSQIFVAEAEKAGIDMDKINNSESLSIPKSPDLYNSIESHQTGNFLLLLSFINIYLLIKYIYILLNILLLLLLLLLII